MDAAGLSAQLPQWLGDDILLVARTTYLVASRPSTGELLRSTDARSWAPSAPWRPWLGWASRHCDYWSDPLSMPTGNIATGVTSPVRIDQRTTTSFDMSGGTATATVTESESTAIR